MNGSQGKILRVNLTTGDVDEEGISEDTYRAVIGGVGIAAWLLQNSLDPAKDVFSPENPIVFATGPLQGSGTPGSAKWVVAGRSPQTGLYGESAAGAGFGLQLKAAGYDALVITGRAEEHVQLVIDDGEVKIKEAGSLWGKDAIEAAEAIAGEAGTGYSIATIGQAGENLVRFASIVADRHSVCGRCGMGAVLGAKNLKAIAVRGSKRTKMADEPRVKQLSRDLASQIAEKASFLGQHGTAAVVESSEEYGDIPIRNWQQGSWAEAAQRLGGPSYTAQLLRRKWPCPCCPIGCHRLVEVSEPKKYQMAGAGPEYETLAMLGPNCLVDDLQAVAKANDMCNRYGMDTISTGSAVAFVMECYENGLIGESDTGREIRWGDADGMLHMIATIAERKGFGDILADGIRNAVREVGEDSRDFAVEIKGLDLPAHDPRAFFALAVNYATGNRGPCHERGNPQVAYQGFLLPEAGIRELPDRFEMEGSERIAIAYQDYGTLTNAFVLCKFMFFGGMGLTDMLHVLNAITQWDMSIDDMLTSAKRVFTLQRVLNTRLGVCRADEVLPKRVLTRTEDGGHAGMIPSGFESALDRYYALRGWDSNGIPTLTTLRSLGLGS